MQRCRLDGGGVSLARLVLAAVCLFSLTPLALSSAIPAPPSSPGILVARDPLEHVTLADCRTSAGVLSSQMAYFPGAPNATPQDVAVVSTPAGQLRLWAGATTAGLFTATGTTFTAKLGPQVGDGEFAGTGDNGYGNFTCWQRFAKALYKYGDAVCNQVYDCSHEAAPKPAATSSSGAGGPTQTPTAGNSSNNNGTSPPIATTDSGLSDAARTAIIAGVVSAVGIAAIAALAWFILKRRAQKKRLDELRARYPGGVPPPPPLPAQDKRGWFGRKQRRGTNPPPYGGPQMMMAPPPQQQPAGMDAGKKPLAPGGLVYELDGQWHGVEVHGDAARGELDDPSTPGTSTMMMVNSSAGTTLTPGSDGISPVPSPGPGRDVGEKERMYREYMTVPR